MGKKKEQEEKKERPLEGWTIKELRAEALKVPDVQGVHGMNKEEVLSVIRKHRGIAEAPKKKGESVREMKAKVIQMRQARDQEREGGAPRSRLTVLRKKIRRLKKLTQTKA